MNCARCGHSSSAHCKGDELHLGWKSATEPFRCMSRHCLEPLCSCIAFVAPEISELAA